MEIFLLVVIYFILVSLSSTYLLTVWFDGAKFFIEYINLFKLDKYFEHIQNFNNIKKSGSPSTYLEYIADYKNNFLVRLVTCEKCLSFWTSTLFGIFCLLSSLTFGFRVFLQVSLLLPILIPACAQVSHKLFRKW